MHVEAPRSARSPKVVTFLRIPVLVAVGMMTMGSGMGNPGCGSSSYSDCEEGCAISGTYAVQFADTSPPGEGCEALGQGLPAGPLVLSLSGTYVTGQLGDDYLSGYYHGEPSRELNFTLAQNQPVRLERILTIESTVRAPAPHSDTDASTIEGQYEVKLSSLDDGSVKCLIRRSFTATR